MKEIQDFVDAMTFNQTGSVFQRNIDILMTLLYGESYQPVGNSMSLKEDGKRIGDVSDFILTEGQQKTYGGVYLQQSSKNSTQKEMEDKFIKKMRSDLRKILEYKRIRKMTSSNDVFLFVVKSFPKTPSDDSRPSRTLLDKIENTEKQYHVKIVLRTLEQLYLQVIMNYRSFTPNVIECLELPPSYTHQMKTGTLGVEIIETINEWISSKTIKKDDWLIQSVMLTSKKAENFQLFEYYFEEDSLTYQKDAIFKVTIKTLISAIKLLLSGQKIESLLKIQKKALKHKKEDSLFQLIFFIASLLFLMEGKGQQFSCFLEGKTQEELDLIRIDLILYYIPKMMSISHGNYIPQFHIDKNVLIAPQTEVF